MKTPKLIRTGKTEIIGLVLFFLILVSFSSAATQVILRDQGADVRRIYGRIIVNWEQYPG